MTAFLREWLLSVTGAAMVLALLLAAMPKGSVRQIGVLAAGMVLFLVLLRPVLDLVPDRIMSALENQFIQASAYPGGLELANENYLEGVMSQRCEEYIVSQAGAMGCQVEVSVTCGWQDGYPFPQAVTIWGALDPGVRKTLEEDLLTHLDIPPEAITYEEADNES